MLEAEGDITANFNLYQFEGSTIFPNTSARVNELHECPLLRGWMVVNIALAQPELLQFQEFDVRTCSAATIGIVLPSQTKQRASSAIGCR